MLRPSPEPALVLSRRAAPLGAAVSGELWLGQIAIMSATSVWVTVTPLGERTTRALGCPYLPHPPPSPVLAPASSKGAPASHLTRCGRPSAAPSADVEIHAHHPPPPPPSPSRSEAPQSVIGPKKHRKSIPGSPSTPR